MLRLFSLLVLTTIVQLSASSLVSAWLSEWPRSKPSSSSGSCLVISAPIWGPMIAAAWDVEATLVPVGALFVGGNAGSLKLIATP